MKARFSILLAALAILLVAGPVLVTTTYGKYAFVGMGWAVLVTGVLVIGRSRGMRRLAILMAVLCVLVDTGATLFPVPILVATGRLAVAVLLGLFVWIILDHILNRRQVTSDVIIGGVCAYVLLGILFAQLFAIFEVLAPGSFLDQGEPLPAAANFWHSHVAVLFYYSFVTLTTVGYGSIYPVSALARSFSIAEAIVGPIYLVILVGHLVGMRIAQSIERPREE